MITNVNYHQVYYFIRCILILKGLEPGSRLLMAPAQPYRALAHHNGLKPSLAGLKPSHRRLQCGCSGLQPGCRGFQPCLRDHWPPTRDQEPHCLRQLNHVSQVFKHAFGASCASRAPAKPPSGFISLDLSFRNIYLSFMSLWQG